MLAFFSVDVFAMVLVRPRDVLPNRERLDPRRSAYSGLGPARFPAGRLPGRGNKTKSWMNLFPFPSVGCGCAFLARLAAWSASISPGSWSRQSGCARCVYFWNHRTVVRRREGAHRQTAEFMTLKAGFVLPVGTSRVVERANLCRFTVAPEFFERPVWANLPVTYCPWRDFPARCTGTLFLFFFGICLPSWLNLLLPVSLSHSPTSRWPLVADLYLSIVLFQACGAAAHGRQHQKKPSCRLWFTRRRTRPRTRRPTRSPMWFSTRKKSRFVPYCLGPGRAFFGVLAVVDLTGREGCRFSASVWHESTGRSRSLIRVDRSPATSPA